MVAQEMPSIAINFSVDNDIVIHGVCFLGSENMYSVDLDVMNSISKIVVVSSEGLQSEKRTYRIFEVLFGKKVVLKKNTMYDLWARITEPD